MPQSSQIVQTQEAKNSALKSVLEETKLLPQPGGLAEANSQFGHAVSMDGSWMLVGAPYASGGGEAVLFEHDGVDWRERATLQADDRASGDTFGISVAIQGDRILIGAYRDDDLGDESGSAYVFERNGLLWHQTAKLKASDGNLGDRFGVAVSLQGNQALIGAYSSDDLGSNSGSAYLFDFDGVNWTETIKLLANDGAAGNLFGFDLDLGVDRLMVGAFRESSQGSHAGAAYVFERVTGTWQQTAKLTAADADSGDSFGVSVSLSGDRALIGADFDEDQGNFTGSAYVFEFNGVSWQQTHKLFGTGAVGDKFGYSLELKGDRAVVAAYQGDANGTDTGQAYVFDYDGMNWVRKGPLIVGDGMAGDELGFSVALNGDVLVLGAHYDEDFGTHSGAAYVFEFDGVDWLENTKLTAESDTSAFDFYGTSVSIVGDRAVVGADGDDDNGLDSGAVYVYEFDGNDWLYSAKIKPNDGLAGDFFGFDVSLGNDRVLIGAFGADDNGSRSGVAYVFDFDGTTWQQTDKLVISSSQAQDNFGYSVSLSGDRALIGAKGEDDVGSDSGAAYVFDFDGNSWIEGEKLSGLDTASGDQFGGDVSLEGNRAVIGALYDDDLGSSSGSAYVFDFDGTDWNQSAKLVADDGAAGDFFGEAVGLSGGRVLVGAWGKDTNGSNSGAAYVFTFDGFGWPQTDQLVADDASITSKFGDAVVILGDRLLIGADQDGTTGHGINAGSAYEFKFDGMDWIQTDKLIPSDAAEGKFFGYAVALSEHKALISAPEDDQQGPSAGAAYVLNLDPPFDVNVEISGLVGTGLSISSNVGDVIAINNDGLYRVSTILDGESYSLNMESQPAMPNQVCEFTDPSSGTLDGGDVTVNVSCVTDVHSIGGQVSGLAVGNSVTLALNGNHQFVVVKNNVSFTFNNVLDDGSVYEVSVWSQPDEPNQTCVVKQGSGTVNGANVTEIDVQCDINQYQVGGTVLGLISDNELVLQNNLGDDLSVSQSGQFMFSSPVADLSAYDVSLLNGPVAPEQNCELFNASGTIDGSDVNNIIVLCEDSLDLIYKNGFD